MMSDFYKKNGEDKDRGFFEVIFITFDGLM